MKNKNIIALVVLVIAVVGVSAYLSNRQPSYNPKTEGKVVLGITDAAENIGNVSAVLVTVNKIEMHSATNSWTTVSDETKEYDLLVLKQSGAVSLLTSANIDAGAYDQIRLNISKVIVVKNGVRQEAKLPSGKLKIVGNFVVKAGETSSVIFDFIADKSLHLTGNGKFIFTPVLKIDKRSNVNFELKLNNEINILSGKKDGDEEDFGMDEKGEVRVNFELKGDLEIDSAGIIGFDDDNNDDDDKTEKNDDSDDDNDKLVFNLSAQNNSGLSGTATLSKEDNKVKVVLNPNSGVLGLLSITKPAHIHFGSCANIGGVKYPLNSVVDGKSETILNVSLAELKAGFPLAINIHKSAVESNIYVACADLKF